MHYSFELAWKTLKDYIEYGGITLSETTPRNVIKEAALSGVFNAAGIVPDVFLDMLLSRNALSHIFDFEKFKIVLEKQNCSFWENWKNCRELLKTSVF
jgi:nucleotidyltransferase substrate binding protein (TIGR01987 family)